MLVLADLALSIVRILTPDIRIGNPDLRVVESNTNQGEEDMSEWLERWFSALIVEIIVEEWAHFTHGLLRFAPYALTALGSMTHVVTLHDIYHLGAVIAAAQVNYAMFP